MWKTQVQHWQWHSPHRWPETKWRSTGAPGGDLGKWHCTAGSSTGAPPPPPPRQQCPSASKSGTPGCGDTLLVQVLLHNYSTVSMLSCIRLHCSGRLTSQQFGRVAGYIVGCPSPGEDVQLGLLRRRARPTVGKIRKGASQPPFKLKLFELFIKIGPHRSLHQKYTSHKEGGNFSFLWPLILLLLFFWDKIIIIKYITFTFDSYLSV